jgi:hypothetical protein
MKSSNSALFHKDASAKPEVNRHLSPGCRAIACRIVVMPSSGPGSRISAITSVVLRSGARGTLGQHQGCSAEKSNDILSRIRCLVPDARSIDEPLACRNESDARFHGTFTTPPDSTLGST